MTRQTRRKRTTQTGGTVVTLIRLPVEVRERLKRRAEAEQRSMSNMAVRCISDHLDATDQAA